MAFLYALFTSLIEAAGAFFPISATGVLAAFQIVFHYPSVRDQMLLFDCMAHIGLAVSVFLHFRLRKGSFGYGLFSYFRLTGTVVGKQDKRLYRRVLYFLVFSMLPSVLIIPFRSKLGTAAQSDILIGFLYIAGGIALYAGSKMRPGSMDCRSMTVKSAFGIGFSQLFSYLPGISRIGTTVSAGYYYGLTRTYAFDYSLILSIPVYLIYAVFQFTDISFSSLSAVTFLAAFLTMVLSAAGGYFLIALAKRFIEKTNYLLFAYFSWGFGLIVLILSLIR